MTIVDARPVHALEELAPEWQADEAESVAELEAGEGVQFTSADDTGTDSTRKDTP